MVGTSPSRELPKCTVHKCLIGVLFAYINDGEGDGMDHKLRWTNHHNLCFSDLFDHFHK